jgi:hypothetical protein
MDDYLNIGHDSFILLHFERLAHSPVTSRSTHIPCTFGRHYVNTWTTTSQSTGHVSWKTLYRLVFYSQWSTDRCWSSNSRNVKMKLSLCTQRRYVGSGGIARLILNLDTKWTWAINFTPRSLHPHGSPRHQLNRRISEPQSWSGHFERERCLFSLPGIDPWFPGRAAHSLLTIATELSHSS